MDVLQAVLSSLTEHEGLDKYSNLALSSHKLDALTDDEKRLFTMVFYTVIERKISYDYYIATVANRSIDDISPRAKSILRIGVCQLLDINSIPDHAAVNESVRLAKSQGERAFVNAVLREIQRRKNCLPVPNKEKDFARYLSVKYSFPKATVKHFISLLGDEGTEQLLNRFNTARYTDISVNKTKISREEYLQRLLSDGYDARLSSYSELGIRIESSVNPCKLFGYDEGYFFVQDEASCIISSLLSPQRGMRIIDVCSAPGGKSFSLASYLDDNCEIFSFDLQKSKLSLISSGAERLGFNSIKVACLDATAPIKELFGTADRVICDVPCSGLGILPKKADIRYKDLNSAALLPPLQYEILTKSASYLKEDGILLYSTCTINRAENEDVVQRFLDENPEFTAVPFELGTLKADNGMITLYPHIHKTDGFFIAKLKRREH